MTEHYFSESPQADSRQRDIEVTLAGAPRTVVTAGGVFSPEQLDRGTQVLLNYLAGEHQSPGNGPVLDIGCGWGPIALDAALTGHEVWAIDVNERSRELTKANAKRLGVEHLVNVCAPDEVPADIEFAEIRSNPPIRVGKEVLHGIMREWLPRLMDGGEANMVVAKHLGADSLQRWIDDEFADIEIDRVSRSKGFHILKAIREAAE